MYKPNTNSSSIGRFLKGDELRVCYDTEIEFPASLARGMAETLSESSRVSRVRSGYSSGNWVKAFSLFGVIGLARLSSGKAKTLSQACFGLIP
jgi:hypothetical protein